MANTLILMLTDEERAVLDFERGWFIEPGPKEPAIEFRLGIQPAIYYDILRELVMRPEAKTYDPLTVGRVRRLMESAS